MTEKVAAIIARDIRPSLQAHGGDIELLEITPDGFARVRLIGACAACPGAQQTLAEVVETALCSAKLGIKGVIPSYQVDESLIRQALAMLRRGQTENGHKN